MSELVFTGRTLMTRFTIDETEEELVIHEDGVWAIDLEHFVRDQSLFNNSFELSTPIFVEEIIAKKEWSPEGHWKWDDVVAANDPISKLRLLKKYFSKENSKRLYRAKFEFYLSFHNWIDPTQPFSEILIHLKDQYDALSLIADWYDQGKIKIVGKDSSPALLNFLVTLDIFHEAIALSGIGYNINDTEKATLAKNHYLDENEEYRKKYGL